MKGAAPRVRIIEGRGSWRTRAFNALPRLASESFIIGWRSGGRHFLVSALIPYGHILSLGIGLLLVTLVAGSLQAMGQESVEFLGRRWSLGGLSGALLYLLGVAGEVFVLTSIYLVMPVGRLSVWLGARQGLAPLTRIKPRRGFAPNVRFCPH